MLLEEHPEELEADFQRVYQVDLLDLFRGEITPRKAAALAANLPPGSAVWVAMGGERAWSPDQHLLALVEHNTRIAWWAKTKDGSKGRRPPQRLRPPKSPREEALKAQRATRALHRQRARAATRARLGHN
jgi:hypothetical protein